VSPLFAIEPQRRGGIRDGKAVLRNRRRVGPYRLVAGINTTGRLGAWIIEARLGDGMIPGHELESNDIALGRINTVRGEGQSSVQSNLDGDIGGRSASSEAQESRNDGSEMHFSDK